MALLHRATIVPTKSELVAAWLPRRSWAPLGPIVDGVSYRLDDPAGEVGMEAFLLTDSDGVTVHVPLTYRGQPRAGAEHHLLGTMEHSVLGTRWVYDGCADPVWAATLATTIATGGTQAEELVDVGGRLEPRAPTMHVRGSGTGSAAPSTAGPWQVGDDDTVTTIAGEAVDLIVVRRVGAPVSHPLTLTASWAGHEAVVAGLRLR